MKSIKILKNGKTILTIIIHENIDILISSDVNVQQAPSVTVPEAKPVTQTKPVETPTPKAEKELPRELLEEGEVKDEELSMHDMFEREAVKSVQKLRESVAEEAGDILERLSTAIKNNDEEPLAELENISIVKKQEEEKGRMEKAREALADLLNV